MLRRSPALPSRIRLAPKSWDRCSKAPARLPLVRFNNDGKPDLFVVSGRPLGPASIPNPLRKPPAETPHNHLYRNDGNGHFTDVTEKAGLAGDSFSFSAIAADFDNDGYTDLLVTSYGKVTLYRNKGDGTFEDVTVKAGLGGVKGWAIGATWLDYDRDGCIDLFIGRYVKFDPLTALTMPPITTRGRSTMAPTATCCSTIRARAPSSTSARNPALRHSRPHHGRHRGRLRWRWLPRYLRRQR